LQHDRHPVVCVNWNDAKAYAAWMSSLTGKNYGLLSEAEREYVARAGSTGPFWWGAAISTDQANYNGNFVYAGGQRRAAKGDGSGR
jgi:formylglycine-generating enzyme required for sulfatase activity